MIRVLSISAALLFAGSAEAKKVHFTWQPLEAGTEVTLDTRNEAGLDAVITIGGQQLTPFRATMQQIEAKTLRVTEADGGDPHVVDISWTDRRWRQSRVADEVDETDEDVHPVSGRTFTVDVSTGELEIRPDANGPNLEAVQTAGTQLANLLEIGAILDGEKLKTGASMQASPIAELVGSLVGGHVSKTAVTLNGMRKIDGDKLAIFDLELHLDEQSTMSGAGLGMDLSGEIWIEPRTARLRAIHLDGPVKMEGRQSEEGIEMHTKMDGAMEARTALEWSDE